jgi:hypothetical protein
LSKRVKLPLVGATVALLTAIAVGHVAIWAQPTPSLQPGFNEAIDTIDHAEAAGATKSEIRPLVCLLNNALELNLEAKEAPNGSAARTQRLLEVDGLLTKVESQAVELTLVASHRTFLNKIIAYVGGGVAAVVGTLLYLATLELNERYLVNRIFRMRVRPK